MRDERLTRMWGSKKNCVHESMIPDWMDLVVWGHEHESRIEAVESDVGTFRVVQPGSSVATRLVEWESVAKKVTVLEIAGSEFRVRPFNEGSTSERSFSRAAQTWFCVARFCPPPSNNERENRR
ncbi:hypothetical protein ScalyP_jg182 [Parmales sp. scaly parma]|nr:hypothetical protein ScalyP_jg182 [Parmales sp. scaly parma]